MTLKGFLFLFHENEVVLTSIWIHKMHFRELSCDASIYSLHINSIQMKKICLLTFIIWNKNIKYPFSTCLKYRVHYYPLWCSHTRKWTLLLSNCFSTMSRLSCTPTLPASGSHSLLSILLDLQGNAVTICFLINTTFSSYLSVLFFGVVCLFSFPFLPHS